MALTDAQAIILKKKDNLLRDDRILMFHIFTYGPYITADGIADVAQFTMPFDGEIIEVVYGCETSTAKMDFNIENDGSDIWVADKADLVAGEFNAEPGQNRAFVRGAQLTIAVSDAGTAIVGGGWAILVAFWKYTKK